MIKYLISILAGVIFFGMSGCQKKEESKDNNEARELFMKSADLLIDFTDKIEGSQDSSSIDSLLQLYDKKSVDLNFSVPPGTDYKLTEQENDSLFKLLQNMKRIVEIKFENFSRVTKDTIDTSIESKQNKKGGEKGL